VAIRQCAFDATKRTASHCHQHEPVPELVPEFQKLRLGLDDVLHLVQVSQIDVVRYALLHVSQLGSSLAGVLLYLLDQQLVLIQRDFALSQQARGGIPQLAHDGFVHALLGAVAVLLDVHRANA
jgi:hypothetical protein